MKTQKQEKVLGSTVQRKVRRNDENQELKLKIALCKDEVSLANKRLIIF